MTSFRDYQEERRQRRESPPPVEVSDEGGFAAYKAQREAAREQKMSASDAFLRGAHMGASWYTADESAGVDALREDLLGPVGKAINFVNNKVMPVSPMNAADAFVGLGLDAFGYKGEAFTEGMEAHRAADEQAREDQPVATFAGEIGGAVATPGGAAKGTTRLIQASKAAGSGLIAGGAAGFASGEGDLEERADETLIGAGGGALFGGALGAVLPRSTALTEALTAELSSGIRPQATQAIDRLLRHSGLSSDDIRRLGERISSFQEGVGAGGSIRPQSIAQFIVKELEDTHPQAADNLLAVLRERRLSVKPGDESPSIIGGASKEMRESQTPFLQQSLATNLGDTTREAAGEAIEESKQALGRQYEALLDQPFKTPGAAERVKQVIQGPGLERLTQPLKTMAAAEGMNLDQMIASNPMRAAHWMQHKAGLLADTPNKADANAMMSLRQRILTTLEDAVPGYRDVRLQYGDEMAQEKALAGARDFLRRATNEGDLDAMAREYAEMPENVQQAYNLALRDHLGSMLRGGPEDAQARIARLTNTGVLDALERVLGEPGKKIADDLRAVRSEQRFLGSFDPDRNSRTAANLMSVGEAPTLYNSFAANAIRADGQGMGVIPVELAASQVAPGLSGWYAGYRGLKAAADQAFGTRNATLEDMSKFLMSRPGVAKTLDDAPVIPGAPAPAAGPANLADDAGNKGRVGEKLFVSSAAAGSVGLDAISETTDYTGEIEVINQQIAQIEAHAIPRLEEDLRLLEDASADPRAIQELLARRGFDVGPIDGVIGPRTRQAVADNIAQLRQDRDTLRDDVENLQSRRNDLEIRALSAEQAGGNPFLEKGAPAAALVLGLLGATKLRGRGLAKSRAGARAIEDRANSLIARMHAPGAPVPSPLRRFLPGQSELRDRVATERAEAATEAKRFSDRLAGRGEPGFSRAGVNSPDTRAANVNEVWRMGGAGENVPFEPKARGGWKPRPGAADPSTLYQPQTALGRIFEPITNRIKMGDVAMVATGSADAALMEPLIQSARKDIEEAKADLTRYESARDVAGIERAQERLQQAETMELVFVTAQRLGIGLAAGGTLGPLKGSHAKPRPDMAAAERERALVAREIANQR